jgi:uncharacterized membrane protein YdjX (TVP38/TMEM64 family)
MVVEGPVAKLLGELARERWRRATGKKLREPKTAGNCWPVSVEPEWTDAAVAVSRTVPAYDKVQEIREIQNLYCDAISKAKQWIYIESQYLTSYSIKDAIEKKLREPDGPEVLLILPRASSGWLEARTMDVIRANALNQLKSADAHHRLETCYPVVGEQDIHVHSKLLIIDGNFISIGSANLSNRSMGLDTECNLSIESNGAAHISKGILQARNRLLGEHLGIPEEEIPQRLLEFNGSMLELVRSRAKDTRRLNPVEVPVIESNQVIAEDFIDPERPIDVERWLLEAFPPDEKQFKRWDFLRVTGYLFLAGLLIAGIWHWTPVRDFLDPRAIAAAGERFSNSPASVPLIILTYVIGVIIFVPVTIMSLGTIFLFGPITGFLCALLGLAASATVTYGLGRLLGRNTVRKIAGRKLNRLSRFLTSRGILTMSLATLLPLAPFGVVNMVAGVSRIRFRDFILGSVIGGVPAILAMTVFERGLRTAFSDRPEPLTLFLIVLAAALLLYGSLRFQKWIQSKRVPASV